MSFGPILSAHVENSLAIDGQNLAQTTRSGMSGSDSKKILLMKEVDLTTDEVLDGFKIAMKKLGREHRKDAQVYNMLAKMSMYVVNERMTWSKALEYHYSRNFVKAKSIQVSQNFIFRKFFCKWLEIYLARQNTENSQAELQNVPVKHSS